MSEVDQLEVRGGVGGMRARLDDLVRSGELLRTGAGILADHGRAVVMASVDPRLHLTAPLSPVTFARAEAALAGAAFGPGGLFAVAARAQLLGSGVLLVAEGCQAADAAAAVALQAAATLTGQVIGGTLGPAGPGLLLGTASVMTVSVRSESARAPGEHHQRLPEPLRRTGELALRLLTEHAGLTETAVSILPGVMGGFVSTVPGGPVISAKLFGHPAGPSTVAEVATGLGRIGPLAGAVTGTPPWFRDQAEVQIRAAPAPWRRPPSGTADLLRRVPDAAADRPQIHLQRVDGATGRRWVVAIPGTANWSPIAGRTPFDLTGNVQQMAGERTVGMAGVVAALRATGARKGEPILLVGYSQGGLIAAALAADPEVRAELSISHVLTSGAPVASVPIPDDVQVLSIEHSEDLVPQLEGSANRDRPNWITVTAPAPKADLPSAESTEPLLAHRNELYQSTAELVDRSTHPSIVRWQAGLAPFLDRTRGSEAGQDGFGASWNVEVSRVGTP